MNIRRITGVAATTAAMVGTMVAVGAPAQAASACTSTGNGSLCIYTDPAGYDASYHKTSGATAYVDFNLVCDNGRTFGDNGAFYISAGQVKTYTFAVGSQGACRVKLIDKNTGSYWLTPRVSR